MPVLAVLAALVPAVVAAANESPALSITTVSNRADLLSGGDALVEIALPEGADPETLSVTAGGQDATEVFHHVDGRILGRLEGLALGTTTVVASADGATGASLDVTNHALGGPIFSGPQIQPWVCTTASNGLGDPVDAQCNAAAPLVEWFYVAEGDDAFQAYDPSNPPGDVAQVTIDNGATVPFIVRQETGTQNRGIYTFALIVDPAKPFEPWDRQAGWNGKLFYPYGASCGTNHTQGSAQGVLDYQALSRGFAVATSSMNVLGNNCNTVTSAESTMMLKEHIVDHFGEIRFTFGRGSSGGSIGQHMIANNYPGLLQGLIVGSAFPDNISTGQEVFDCHMMFHYFTQTSPHLWANVAQQMEVTGNGASAATCAGWDVLFSPVGDPTNGCGSVPNGDYNAETNPTGCRGTYQDFSEPIFGKRAPELWGAPEQAYGGFALGLYDNEGVQFGLQALRDGLITTEQFVDLNEKIGGLDIDFNFIPGRSRGDANFAETIYRAGQLNDAGQLDQVAIIDSRGTGNIDPLTIHTMHHSFVLKERLEAQHGTSENHVLFRGPGAPDTFLLMDEWLTAVEADATGAPLADRILANRPAAARDECWYPGGRSTNEAQCDVIWPYYSAPRSRAAGGPFTHDVVKCALKPIDRDDDYGRLPFTDAQWQRLEATFPTGVCDWTRPSQQFAESIPWLTFAGGPGGQPLGDPPASQPLS